MGLVSLFFWGGGFPWKVFGTFQVDAGPFLFSWAVGGFSRQVGASSCLGGQVFFFLGSPLRLPRSLERGYVSNTGGGGGIVVVLVLFSLTGHQKDSHLVGAAHRCITSRPG